jgi:hypothetical protein
MEKEARKRGENGLEMRMLKPAMKREQTSL